jgi:mannosyltransferase
MPRPRPLPKADLISVVLGTGVLGLYRLGAKGLWHDEAYSDAVARLDSTTMWHAIRAGEGYHGMHHALLQLWLAVVGTHSEFWLRVPSVVCASAAAGVLFVFNRRVFGQRPALVAAVLLAINAMFVQYAQEARAYMLAVLLVVLSTCLLRLALLRSSRRYWVMYAVASALAIYAHLFSIFVVASHLVSLPVAPGRFAIRRVTMAYALIGLLLLPLFAVAESRDALALAAPSLSSLKALFLALAGGGTASVSVRRVLQLAYLIACSLGLHRGLQLAFRGADDDSREQLWGYAVVGSWLAVPILATFATAQFQSRYLIVALPALVTIAAIGVSSLRGYAFHVAFAALLMVATFPLVAYYRADFKQGEDWKRAVAYVVGNAQPGDGVVFLSRYGRRPFEYYFAPDLRGEKRLTPIYPAASWGSYVPVFADRDIEPTTDAAHRLRGFTRVWAILLWGGFRSFQEDGTPVQRALSADYERREAQNFGSKLNVVLYEKLRR